MPRKDQILQMVPAERIEFSPPFTTVSESSLRLKNPSEKNVAFKIKTTAPQRYCVRPNASTVPPNGEAIIKVMLQPGGTDERHKFMVQSIYVPDDYNQIEEKEEKKTFVNSLWADSTNNPVMSSKLICVFQTENQQNKPEEEHASMEYNPAQEKEDNPVGNVRVNEEALYQHQQVTSAADQSSSVSGSSATSSVAPKPKKSVQINESRDMSHGNQSEEIRRLEQELRDARKQIEILSSAPPPATGSTGQTAEQQKLFLILLFVSFMAGFIISAML